jgi:hypothetical protein
MTMDNRLTTLETSMAKMADKFSDFLAIESARSEREKQHTKEVEELKLAVAGVDKKVSDFIDAYKEHDKPVVDSARKWQGWFFWWLTRVVTPVILTAILYTAGAQIYDRASIKQESIKPAKTTLN